MIPQELTPESITANIGRPMEKILYKNKKSAKQIKHKKRYKMHRHTQRSKKVNKYKANKETRVKYRNVNKHLIKRGNKRTQTTKRSDNHWAERSSYEAPISKQLESVLNAKATRDFPYSNEKSNTMQRKRSYPPETRRSHIEDSDFNYDYDYDDTSDENSGNSKDFVSKKQISAPKVAKNKKRKTNKKAKTVSRKSSSKHRMQSKTNKEMASYNTIGNKTMMKQKPKYEAPVRKFKFFGVAKSDIHTDNKTLLSTGN